MNLIEVMEKFPDQASCIAHLEKIRWKGNLIVHIVNVLMSINEIMKLKQDVLDDGIVQSVKQHLR